MKNNFKGQVIPINRDNVDTDLIIPKQYLKSIKKSGFGPYLFDSLRYKDTATLDSNDKREENLDFILSQESHLLESIIITVPIRDERVPNKDRLSSDGLLLVITIELKSNPDIDNMKPDLF